MKTLRLQSKLPDREVLRKAVDNARRQSMDEHSLLCVHVCNISKGVVDNLNATLAQLARAIGGPVTLAEINPGDYALFLAGWPPVRARQVARLIRAVIQKEEELRGETIRIGFLPIQENEEDIDVFLENAQQLCRADTGRLNSPRKVDIISLQPADSRTDSAHDIRHNASE